MRPGAVPAVLHVVTVECEFCNLTLRSVGVSRTFTLQDGWQWLPFCEACLPEVVASGDPVAFFGDCEASDG